MNTTTAATQAHVTVATIRTWCRRGAIAATKQAGRWIIDTASLARRITIGAMKQRPAQPAPVRFTTENMIAIGGNRWQRGDMDRVYINGWARLAGLETTHYKTGNISGATWQGERISNSEGYRLATCIDKVWYDAADGKLHCRYGWSEPRMPSREAVWQAVVDGIRTAIAAL